MKPGQATNEEKQTPPTQTLQSVFSNPAFIRSTLFSFLTPTEQYASSQVTSTFNRAYMEAAAAEEHKQDLKIAQNPPNRSCPPPPRKKR